MKRIVSCLTSFCLAFSMLGAPSLAFAADASDSNTASGNTQMDAVQEAKDSAEDTAEEDPDPDAGNVVVADESSVEPAEQEAASDEAIEGEPQEEASSNVSGTDAGTTAYNDGNVAMLKGLYALTPAMAASEEGDPDGEQAPTADAPKLRLSDAGELTVNIKRTVAVAPTTFSISLLDSGGNNVFGDAKSLFAPQSSTVTTFYYGGPTDSSPHIPAGTYNLVISAPNYLDYSQILTYNGQHKKIDIYNYQSANEGLSVDPYEPDDGEAVTSEVVNGSMRNVIPVGNFVGGDNVINDEDADFVKDAIAAGSTDSALDLNADGAVDAEDLAIVVRNAGVCHTSNIINEESSYALNHSAGIRSDDNTTVEGSMAALFSQANSNAAVTLKPENTAQPISETNPVGITIESKGDDSTLSKQTEALEITPPADTAASGGSIASGTISVEAQDEAGNDVIIEGVIASDSSREARNLSANPTTSAAKGGEESEETETAKSTAKAAAMAQARAATQSAEITVENDGTIVVNLQTKVAIKKVTIRVTATANQENLAEIATVEFLSDFGERIPEPQLSIPSNISAANNNPDGQGFINLSVTWGREFNVTGYEISVSGPGYSKTGTSPKESYTFMGDSFNGTVKSFCEYKIKVRSTSGDWRSDWSAPYTHYVSITSKPPAPEYVTCKAGVESMSVSWRCKFAAESYTLQYKKTTDSEWQSMANLTASSAKLSGLEGNASYQVRVQAHNRNGSSGFSNVAECTPVASSLVTMPRYKLMNSEDENGNPVNNVLKVTGNKSKAYTLYTKDGQKSNSVAVNDDWWALMDNDSNTYVYIPDWDSGYHYENYRGPSVTLNEARWFDTIRLAPSDKVSSAMNAVKIKFTDADTNATRIVSTEFYTRYDNSGSRYFEVITPYPIHTSYFEVRTTTGYSNGISISELRIYDYDSLDNDIKALFADEQRTMLSEDVTEENIAALESRANTPDEVSGEYHPHRSTQLAELAYARQILESGAHKLPVIEVDNQITANGNPNSGFAQALSDYQPLGYTAAARDTVILYVTDNKGSAARGANVNLKLVATQVHPEVVSWQSGAIQLKAGRNEITIPRLGSYSKESGGPLYLEYTGKNGGDNYSVRVLNATKIPVLNVDGVTGAERTSRIQAYVSELESYVGGLSAAHDAHQHATPENQLISPYSYNAQECILNVTDITMENMMYSFPATQVLGALGSNKAQKLETAIAAMEQQIDYYYQMKGMNRNASGNNAYPFTRLNIRYHQMFTGAFMYAGSKHIGIEWGSVGGAFAISPVTSDANGKYISGNFTGWGIAHEIGHCINAAAYQRVEVTNNIFANLSTNRYENNAGDRVGWQTVYNMVATGTAGHTGSLSGQLGMYWQLHLAYDNTYAYKLYEDYDEQFANIFYARVDSYIRNRGAAPYALPSSSSGDQLFMQATCAAAQKDILDFFRAWGFHPDASTVAYASNYEKELRPIQFIDNDSRLYRLEGGKGMSSGTAVNASITNATNNRINGRTVEISLANTNTSSNAMLGYEICRDGKMVAFVTADKASYTDTVTTENNKSFTYTVYGVDRLLNKTAAVELPEVKICHDGSISKARWSAFTNAVSPQDKAVDKSTSDEEADGIEADVDSGSMNGNSIPAQTQDSAVKYAIDGDPNTIYYGSSVGARPQFTLNLGRVEQVTAIKFTPVSESYVGDGTDGKPTVESLNCPLPINKCRLFGFNVEVSTDGVSWTSVKTGNAYSGNANNDPSTWQKYEDVVYNEDGSYTLYFCRQGSDGNLDPYMYTYDAAYVRITASNMSAIAVAEFDVLGPTSDNVELVPEGFGRLKSDYQFSEGEENVIPAGSIVFYGEYKGDPAYNVVILRDQDNNVIDGQQIILANVAIKGELGETSDGRWIYWLEDQEKTDYEGDTYNEMDQLASLQKVKAQLYRVQDAMTLAGQRLTSTSLTMAIPSTIPELVLTDEHSSAPAMQSMSSEPAMAQAEAKTITEDVVEEEEDEYVIGTFAMSDPAFSFRYDPSMASVSDGNEDDIYGEVNGAHITDASDGVVSDDNVDAAVETAEAESEAVVAEEAAEAVAAQAAYSAEPALAQEHGDDEIETPDPNDPANRDSDVVENIKEDPIKLSVNDEGFLFSINPDNIAIGSKTVFKLEPLNANAALPASVDVRFDSLSNVYQRYTYNRQTGEITLYTIARSLTLDKIYHDGETGDDVVTPSEEELPDDSEELIISGSITGIVSGKLRPVSLYEFDITLATRTLNYYENSLPVYYPASAELDKHEHEYTTVVQEEVPATCTTAGMKAIFECGLCGDTFGGEELVAYGHDFGEYEVTKEATCTTAGSKKRECAYGCGEIDIAEIEPLGHEYSEDWTEIAPSTCTTAGQQAHKCIRCDMTDEPVEKPALGHQPSEEMTVVREATCTAEGEGISTCSVCGQPAATVTIPALGHDLVEKAPETAATCTSPKKLALFECSRCDYVEGGQYEGEAIGHDFSEIVSPAVAPTCETDGSEVVLKCANCDETRGGEVKNKTGHAWTATYNWADDFKSATVDLACANDPSHNIVGRDAYVEVKEEDGGTRYTATYILDAMTFPSDERFVPNSVDDPGNNTGNTNTNVGDNTNTNTGGNTNTGDSANTNTGDATNTNVGDNANTNTGNGSNANTSTNVNANTGVSEGTNTGTNTSTGVNANVGTNTAANTSTNANANVGGNQASGTSTGTNTATNANTGAGTGTNGGNIGNGGNANTGSNGTATGNESEVGPSNVSVTLPEADGVKVSNSSNAAIREFAAAVVRNLQAGKKIAGISEEGQNAIAKAVDGRAADEIDIDIVLGTVDYLHTDAVIPEADTLLIRNSIPSDAEILGAYDLNVTMRVIVDEKATEVAVTELTNPLEFTVNVDGAKAKDKAVKVWYVHNAKLCAVDDKSVKSNNAAGNVKFPASEFSTYVVYSTAHADAAPGGNANASNGTGSGVGNGSGDGVVAGGGTVPGDQSVSATANGGKVGDNLSKTSDEANKAASWLLLAASVCCIIAAISFMMVRRKKAQR